MRKFHNDTKSNIYFREKFKSNRHVITKDIEYSETLNGNTAFLYKEWENSFNKAQKTVFKDSQIWAYILYS